MLTPQDIETKVFKKSLHGYDAKEVDQFLQEISESYEKLYKENLTANERIRMLSDAVRQYKAMEDSLSSNVGDRETEQILNHSAQEIARVTYQYEQMKRSVEVFRAKVVSLLHAQLDIIKDYSDVLVDDKTLEDAKAVYEKTEEKIAKTHLQEQKTEEIPVWEHTQEIPVTED